MTTVPEKQRCPAATRVKVNTAAITHVILLQMRNDLLFKVVVIVLGLLPLAGNLPHRLQIRPPQWAASFVRRLPAAAAAVVLAGRSGAIQRTSPETVVRRSRQRRSAVRSRPLSPQIRPVTIPPPC